MADDVKVHFIREFKSGTQLGVGQVPSLHNAWFVYMRGPNTGSLVWSMHCGPYSDEHQAAQWCRDIRESGPSREERQRAKEWWNQ